MEREHLLAMVRAAAGMCGLVKFLADMRSPTELQTGRGLVDRPHAHADLVGLEGELQGLPRREHGSNDAMLRPAAATLLLPARCGCRLALSQLSHRLSLYIGLLAQSTLTLESKVPQFCGSACGAAPAGAAEKGSCGHRDVAASGGAGLPRGAGEGGAQAQVLSGRALLFRVPLRSTEATGEPPARSLVWVCCLCTAASAAAIRGPHRPAQGTFLLAFLRLQVCAGFAKRLNPTDDAAQLPTDSVPGGDFK